MVSNDSTGFYVSNHGLFIPVIASARWLRHHFLYRKIFDSMVTGCTMSIPVRWCERTLLCGTVWGQCDSWRPSVLRQAQMDLQRFVETSTYCTIKKHWQICPLCHLCFVWVCLYLCHVKEKIKLLPHLFTTKSLCLPSSWTELNPGRSCSGSF